MKIGLIAVCLLTLIGAIAFAVSDFVADRKIKRQREKAEKEYLSINVCDACGMHPKQPNSRLCKECEVKAYDTGEHQEHT